MANQHLDKELFILENIYKANAHIQQRNLAEIAGLSLGMTNAIIKRLVEKGWLTIRKLNNRNMFYAVTPEGLDAITRKSYRYLKRTIKHIVQYKESITELLDRLKKAGYGYLILIGSSDISFIIEHLCSQQKLHFFTDKTWDEKALVAENQVFILFSEAYTNQGTAQQADETLSGNGSLSSILKRYMGESNRAYLSDLILNKP